MTGIWIVSSQLPESGSIGLSDVENEFLVFFDGVEYQIFVSQYVHVKLAWTSLSWANFNCLSSGFVKIDGKWRSIAYDLSIFLSQNSGGILLQFYYYTIFVLSGLNIQILSKLHSLVEEITSVRSKSWLKPVFEVESCI